MFIIVTLIVPISLSAQAKQHVAPEEKAKEETLRMKEKLNLNDEQTQKVEEINLRYAMQSHEIHQQESQTPGSNNQANREKMKELHEKKAAELKMVFSPEQFEQLKKMEEEMHKEHQKR
jgi:hypothetical protein